CFGLAFRSICAGLSQVVEFSCARPGAASIMMKSENRLRRVVMQQKLTVRNFIFLSSSKTISVSAASLEASDHSPRRRTGYQSASYALFFLPQKIPLVHRFCA